MATQAIPPHPPVATLGPGPASFQKDPRICGKSGGFEEIGGGFYKKVADLRQTRRSRVWGEPWRIFPKSANFLIILKSMIFFQETF
jgi:hypothetical protein